MSLMLLSTSLWQNHSVDTCDMTPPKGKGPSPSHLSRRGRVLKRQPHRQTAHSRSLQSGDDEPVPNSAKTKIAGSCDINETSCESSTFNKDAVESSTLPDVVRKSWTTKEQEW